MGQNQARNACVICLSFDLSFPPFLSRRLVRPFRGPQNGVASGQLTIGTTVAKLTQPNKVDAALSQLQLPTCFSYEGIY